MREPVFYISNNSINFGNWNAMMSIKYEVEYIFECIFWIVRYLVRGNILGIILHDLELC